MHRILLGILAVSVLASGCAMQPDLTVSRLDLSTATAAAGSPITVTSEISNIGAAPAAVPDAPGSDVSTSIDIQVFPSAADTAGVGFLSAWGPTRDLTPGDSEAFTSAATVPSVPPGDYVACGDVDRANHVSELDETNNRRCAPLRIVAAGAGQPDLVFEFVRPLHNEQASFKLDTVVRNVGAATAGPFRVDAFQRSPRRWPVLLTSCPLTAAQRAAGGSAPCGPIFHPGGLAPGESIAWKMWVTMPTDRPSGAVETLDFMVDGCHAPLEPALPAYCRVEESDETNNQVAATISVP